MSRSQTSENGVKNALDPARILNNPAPASPNFITANPRLIWDAGDKLQTSIWMSIAGTGCFILAGLTGSKSAPIVLIGIGGGVTFNILSLINLYGAGEALKRSSGVKEEGKQISDQFNTDNIDGINCMDLPDAVDRYHCSRTKRGK